MMSGRTSFGMTCGLSVRVHTLICPGMVAVGYDAH
jgi:hypothetical protein